MSKTRGNRSRLLRIVGGAWRGRRFRFPDAAEIRPTPDRVRETLFNWLAGPVVGARCLDLFAGSGALGLEALSRGAASVVFVERNAIAANEIQARLEEWGAQGGKVENTDAPRFLERSPPAVPFDVVFLDPPFDSPLLSRVARLLDAGHWVAPAALIYIELPARGEEPELPSSWQPFKAKRAGDVGYHLYQLGVRGGAAT